MVQGTLVYYQQLETLLTAFQTRWIMIFQMPVIAIGVSIATDITQAAGIFCQESNDRHFANIYLRIIMSISLVISVLSILQMYMLLKKDLAHHNPMLKLTAFKIVVGLTFIQGVSFIPPYLPRMTLTV